MSYCKDPLRISVELETRPHHGHVMSGRRTRKRAGVWKDRTPTEQFFQPANIPQALYGFEEKRPESLQKRKRSQFYVNRMQKSNQWAASNWKLVNARNKTPRLFLAAGQVTDVYLSMQNLCVQGMNKQDHYWEDAASECSEVICPKYQSSPKPAPTTGGSGWSNQQGNGAGAVTTGHRQNSPKNRNTARTPYQKHQQA